MSIQRLTVVVDDGFIRVDDQSASGCDMSWVPTYHCEHVGYTTSVHAIQWIGDRGEIELCPGPWGTNMGANIVITNLDDNNLGVGATTALTNRLDAIAAEEAAAAGSCRRSSSSSIILSIRDRFGFYHCCSENAE